MPASGNVLPCDYDTAHVAAAKHRDALIDELHDRGSRVIRVRDALVFAKGRPGPAAWAQNSWLAPREIAIESIGDGVRALRALQRNWVWHPLVHHRRARLIAQRLPAIRFQPLVFPAIPPRAPLGAWTLLARNRLLASSRCSSAFAHGTPTFVEDREGPPNRAYLKLWEALTLARHTPAAGDRCLDLGAAPGGWSWVLAQLGADVVAIDRAELAPALARHPRISHRQRDAFAVRSDDIGAVDWLFSDIIAYPARLLDLARYWCDACPEAAVVMTIKFQGAIDAALTRQFMEVPGSRLHHLAYNKHELTFFRLPGGGPPEAAAQDWADRCPLV